MKLLYGSLDLTDVPFGIEWGSDFGAPQNVTEVFAFLLQDGEVELSNRASNRTLQFNVNVEGANQAELAAAEALLVAESEKPLNTITIDPDDGHGVPTVYKVFRGQVTFVHDDDMDRVNLWRFSVTVQTLPFGRSADEVVVPALSASGSTTTNVDDGSSAANWTGTVNGTPTTPTVTSGAVGITTGTLGATITLTRIASITTSATKFLTFTWGISGVYSAEPAAVFADGVQLPKVAGGRTASGNRTSTYYVAASSIGALQFGETFSASGTGRLHVDNISRSDVRPIIGTTRQQLRTVDMSGSAPAPGTLTVQHATNALGDALVYTWPDSPGNVDDAYVPACSPFTNSGTTTATGNVSGSYTVGVRQYDLPQSMFPAGPYLVLARAASESGTFTGTVAFDVRTIINSTQVDSTFTSADIPVSLTTAYQIVTLGRVNLPMTKVGDPSNTTVRFGVFSSGGSPDVRFDEVWLLNTAIGQVVQVSCGTGSAASGGPSKALFVNAPTVDTPYPTVLRGHAPDQSDAFSASPVAWQFPYFKPPSVHVFTVTTNALDADVSFRFYPHWHTHAAS